MSLFQNEVKKAVMAKVGALIEQGQKKYETRLGEIEEQRKFEIELSNKKAEDNKVVALNEIVEAVFSGSIK